LSRRFARANIKSRYGITKVINVSIIGIRISCARETRYMRCAINN